MEEPAVQPRPAAQLPVPITEPQLQQLVWNHLSRGRNALVQLPSPRGVVTCACVQDVLDAVQYAIKHKLRVLPRAAGHHYGAVFAQPGAVLLDVSPMTAIHVDPEARTARIQPGVTAEMLYDALAPHKLHWPGPHLSNVGCSGFALGGGNGFGSPLLGAACDAVSAFKVVEAGRGRLLHVDAGSHPDMFWGLRGAGAFLGIVTEFELRLAPVPTEMPTSVTVYGMGDAAAVLRAWAPRLESLPSSFESPATLCTGPDGQPCLVLVNQV